MFPSLRGSQPPLSLHICPVKSTFLCSNLIPSIPTPFTFPTLPIFQVSETQRGSQCWLCPLPWCLVFCLVGTCGSLILLSSSFSQETSLLVHIRADSPLPSRDQLEVLGRDRGMRKAICSQLLLQHKWDKAQLYTS